MTAANLPGRRPPKSALLAQAVASAMSRPADSLRAADALLEDGTLKPTLHSDALRARAIALMGAGDTNAALQSVREAIGFAQQAGDRVREARCTANLGIMLASAGQRLQALQSYLDALRLVGPAHEVAAIVCSNIGLLAEGAGEDELALHFHRQALRQMAPSRERAAAALNCGTALDRLNRPDEARPFLIEALEATAATPDQTYHLHAAIALAWLDALQGRPEAACQALRILIRRSHAAGLPVSALRARLLLGEALQRAGHAAEAAEIGDACKREGAEQALMLAPELPLWLARAHAALGHWQRATDLLLEHEQRREARARSAEYLALRTRLFEISSAGLDELVARPSSTPLRYVVSAGAAQRLGLSAGDAEMLRLITLGRTNLQIAHAQSLSVNTVRNRLSRLMHRLQVSTRTAASRRVLGLGVVRADASEAPAAS
jgi:LuxR family transcriptional regulator, maltose regulon positive regulatory protein